MNFDNLSDEELIEWHDSYVLGGFSLIFMVGGMAAGLILSPIRIVTGHCFSAGHFWAIS